MKRTFFGALALSLLGMAPLGAQSWIDYEEQCSTGSMQTCASFQAIAHEYTLTSDDGVEVLRTQLYFRVRNLHFIDSRDGTAEYGGSILAQFGVLAPDLVDPVRDENHLGLYDSAGDGAVFGEGLADDEIVGNPADYWDANSSVSRLNKLGSDVEWALAAGSDGSNDSNGGILSCADPERNVDRMDAYFRTCSTGGWVTFAITTQGTVDMSQLQLAWGVTSDSFTGESWQGTTGPPTEVVPEPITMVLLGTGLAGVGAAARRRKKGLEIETE